MQGFSWKERKVLEKRTACVINVLKYFKYHKLCGESSVMVQTLMIAIS